MTKLEASERSDLIYIVSMAMEEHLYLLSTLLALTFPSATCQSVCPTAPWPPDCPGVNNSLRKTSGSSLVIGGVFSVSSWRVRKDKQDCSLCHKTPENEATTIRFAVEQAEALILATELLNNMTGLGDDFFGYDITDSCGNHLSKQDKTCISKLSPLRNTLATVLGPYYADISVSLDDPEVISIYSRLTSKSQDGRGIFSVLDVPFLNSANSPTGSVSTQVVMFQQTCELQALAAVDFIVYQRWEHITVIGSGDTCGAAALRTFKQELERKGVACNFEVSGSFRIW